MVNNNVLFAIILIGVLVFVSQQPVTTVIDDTSIANLIDAGISFTGRDLYKQGTALTSESVRVIRLNGGDSRKDLGFVSLDSTAFSVTPNVNYKFYYFMNNTPSLNYYVDIEDYVGLEQDAVDNVFGEGCAIDTQPTFWVLDSIGRTQSATSNAQSLGASGTVDVTVNIKANSDKCYGAPSAIDLNKQNAVCFLYTASPYSSVSTNTGKTSKPGSIRSSGNATGKVVECFNFPVIQNAETASFSVTVDASAVEPTSAHNITVMAEDICVDINGNDLSEIVGYEDEGYNNICAPAVKLGTIYIS